MDRQLTCLQTPSLNKPRGRGVTGLGNFISEMGWQVHGFHYDSLNSKTHYMHVLCM